MILSNIQHPDFITQFQDWEKWRYCWAGGRQFINKYLKKYSVREDQGDFDLRKQNTYSPSFAKSEIINVRNSIYERMVEVTRESASKFYIECCNGMHNGVDRRGSTMTHFIGTTVLDELLVMGKVGVYVDMPPNPGDNLLSRKKPYLYIYQREQIKSWVMGEDGHYDTLLLEDCIETTDADTGLPNGVDTRFRLYRRVNGKVHVWISLGKEPVQSIDKPRILNIPYIPFVCFELSHSLMTDICDYQIALLNIESSDVSFLIKANFPAYARMYDPQERIQQMILSSSIKPENEFENLDSGSQSSTKTSEVREVQTGIVKGTEVAKGLEYPKWISPTSENIKASIMKQEVMKKDIKTLLNRSLASLKNNRSSAESKQADQTEEEEGLSYIGLELQRGETLIAKYWCMYDNSEPDSVAVTYPPTYELKNEQDRIEESKKLLEVLYAVPSTKYRKHIFKKIATKLFNNRIKHAELRAIHAEIDTAKWSFAPDPKQMAEAVAGGTCSAETASMMQGFPEGEAEKAQKEHADRAFRIAQAQADAAPRGVNDMGDPQAAKNEKQGAADPTMDKGQGKGKRVRGEAK